MRDDVAREIEQTLGPAIRADGGDVELVEVTNEGVVRLKLGKAWASSPATALAVRYVVEEHLKRVVPGVTSVETAFDYPRPARPS
jgi:Fe-S cluster biogenesis protein NfuA